jgi:hypothetical protein
MVTFTRDLTPDAAGRPLPHGLVGAECQLRSGIIPHRRIAGQAQAVKIRLKPRRE